LNNQSFWRKLIERDLGIIPKFGIDYKLHYLRAMHLPLAGVVVDVDGKTLKKNVVMIFGKEGFLLADKSIAMGDLRILPPKGEHFRWLNPFHNEHSDEGEVIGYHLITNNGNIYNHAGLKISAPGRVLIAPPMGHSGYLLTMEGEIYWTKSYGGDYQYPYHVPLPEKIIQVHQMRKSFRFIK
jgi:hypothetical protein